MKSIYVLWLGTLIAVMGLISAVFSNYLKVSCTIAIVGILIQVYSIYLVKQE